MDEQKRNVVLITLDCLRWDTVMSAVTPNINEFFGARGINWHRVYAQATYTLPAHMAALIDGRLPCIMEDADIAGMYPGHYIRVGNKMKRRIFRGARYPEDLTMYPNVSARSVPEGFSRAGYCTYGLAGVNWFNPEYITTPNWKEMFGCFVYKIQSSTLFRFLEVLDRWDFHNIFQQPYFVFFNCPIFHPPCQLGGNTWNGQVMTLEYFDANFRDMMGLFQKGTHVILWSDHGTCFKEKDAGAVTHGFYHPKVMEVPIIDFYI